ncbi:hypothetical protein OS493_019082 [Desmophyllum pertusum]|uniref:Uncharacterized protein n=1 Tax=Desmophyllum pertusum TaxID=174260 RepID=A0A9X0CM78_9CNID|nr:hypothetical protein OS493_019082 [Desmophyllum pertusum]
MSCRVGRPLEENEIQGSRALPESGRPDIKSPMSSSDAVDLDLEAFLDHLHHILIALSPQSADGGKYNLLEVVDEYRFVEKDISLVEVYELCPREEIKLVNFELNYV